MAERRKHGKYSTIALILILGTIFITIIAGALTSSEIDEICAVEGKIIKRINGTWQCSDENVTLQNITANSIQCPDGQYLVNTSIDETGDLGGVCVTPTEFEATLTKTICNDGEYSRWNGSGFYCFEDLAGMGAGGNVTGVSVTGTTTKTITINNSDGTNVSATFTDIDTDDDTTYNSDEIYIYEATETFYMNESKLNSTIESHLQSTTYYPTSLSILYGTGANNNTGNISLNDEEIMNITEANGANALEFYVNFTGVTETPNYVCMEHQYTGTHTMLLYVYNYDESDWDLYDTITQQPDLLIDCKSLSSGVNYANNDIVKLKFTHPSTGVATHKFRLDYINVVHGLGVTNTQESDPYYFTNPSGYLANSTAANHTQVYSQGNITMPTTDTCIVMSGGKLCSNSTNIWMTNN